MNILLQLLIYLCVMPDWSLLQKPIKPCKPNPCTTGKCFPLSKLKKPASAVNPAFPRASNKAYVCECAPMKGESFATVYYGEHCDKIVWTATDMDKGACRQFCNKKRGKCVNRQVPAPGDRAVSNETWSVQYLEFANKVVFADKQSCDCKNGRYGSRCEKTCPYGWFGQDCLSVCSPNGCKKKKCDRKKGCTKCNKGYKRRPFCDQLKCDGRASCIPKVEVEHGWCSLPAGVNISRWPSHEIGLLDADKNDFIPIAPERFPQRGAGGGRTSPTQDCSCDPGWRTETESKPCQQSCSQMKVPPGESGFYGDNCETPCGRCKNSQLCNPVTGHCRVCEAGLLLPFCKDEESTQTSSPRKYVPNLPPGTNAYEVGGSFQFSVNRGSSKAAATSTRLLVDGNTTVAGQVKDEVVVKATSSLLQRSRTDLFYTPERRVFHKKVLTTSSTVHFQEIPEKFKRRLLQESPQRIAVEFNLIIPETLARSSNLQMEVTSNLKKGKFRSKSIPGLTLDKESVSVNEARFVSSPGAEEKPSLLAELTVGALVCVALAIVVVGAAWSFHCRRKSKAIAVTQTPARLQHGVPGYRIEQTATRSKYGVAICKSKQMTDIPMPNAPSASYRHEPSPPRLMYNEPSYRNERQSREK